MKFKFLPKKWIRLPRQSYYGKWLYRQEVYEVKIYSASQQLVAQLQLEQEIRKVYLNEDELVLFKLENYSQEKALDEIVRGGYVYVVGVE
jgi:hypothetical protein